MLGSVWNQWKNKDKEYGIQKILRGVLIAASFVCAFEYSTTDIIPILIGVIYVIASGNIKCETSKKESMCINILSIILTLFLLSGKIEIILRYSSRGCAIFSLIVSFMGIYFLIELIIKQIICWSHNNSLVISQNDNKLPAKFIFIGSMLCTLVCWGISFLIAYPADYSWDSSEILEEALGSLPMDTQYPVFMTLWLRLCWNIGYAIWKTANAGVAFYIVIQMVLMSCAVSYTIYRIYCCNVKMSICLLILGFYSFVPYNVHYSHSLFKDIPLAVCTLLFMILLWEFYELEMPHARKVFWIKIIVFIFAGMGMAMAKSNGYYAFIFSLPFCIYLFLKKDKRIIVSLMTIWVAVMIIQGPVTDYIFTKNNQMIADYEYPPFDIRYKNAQKLKQKEVEVAEGSTTGSDTEGETTVPESNVVEIKNATASYAASGVTIVTVQQLARVAIDRELSEEEYEELSQFFDVEQMKIAYRKDLSDPALALLRVYDVKVYLKTWFNFAFKYPYTYFVAWRDLTSAYYYPDIIASVITHKVNSELPEIYADSFFSSEVVAKREIVDDLYMKIPIYGILWSIGFGVWITFIAITLTICKKNIKTAFLFAPLIGIWLTILVATPANGTFRYLYPFFICLPVSVIIPFVKCSKDV